MSGDLKRKNTEQGLNVKKKVVEGLWERTPWKGFHAWSGLAQRGLHLIKSASFNTKTTLGSRSQFGFLSRGCCMFSLKTPYGKFQQCRFKKSLCGPSPFSLHFHKPSGQVCLKPDLLCTQVSLHLAIFGGNEGGSREKNHASAT